MPKPTVSVIIPAFNAEKSIARALRSVLRQTYDGEIEILLINDGSTDQTRSVIQKYIKNESIHCPIHIIDQKNAGVSAARNTGLALAKGDYIAFLDSDDAWSPKKLDRQISKMQESPDGDWLCLTNIRVRTPDGKEEDARPYPSDLLNPTDPLDLEGFYKHQVPVLPSTWLAPHRVFQKNGGFDQRLQCAEDGEWVLRLLENGGQLRMVDEPLTTYSASEGKSRPHREASFKLIGNMHLAWMQKECPWLAAYFMERANKADIYLSPEKTEGPPRPINGLEWQIKRRHKPYPAQS